jgi:hypothetical protein
MIEPDDFFYTCKLRMIGNIVGNADKLIKRQNGRAVLPLDQVGCDRKILIMRTLTGSQFATVNHCRLVASA